MIKLTAYDFSIYGGLKDGRTHQRRCDRRRAARIAAESYYIVRVRTSRGRRGAGDKHLKIIPGMQATVDIRTDAKRCCNTC